MTASAPAARPDGGAGSSSLPRRTGTALRAVIRNGQLLRWFGSVGAVIPALALAFILVILIIKSWPAVRISGFGFFSSKAWSQGNQYALKPVIKNGYPMPPGADYGALPLIVGTLATSLIALIIAVPVAIGTALTVVERLPRRLAYIVGLFLEVLAGMPSVIIGLFGAVTLGPLIAKHIAPWVARNAPDVPVLSYLRGDTGSGYGLLTSGLVLALMVIPIIAATTRDLIRQVPILPREGALALGMSDAQTARKVTLPWVSSGIVGSVVLGLGRALGETMAVAMVCGASFGSFPSNLYDTMITAAASIVLTLESALTDATGYSLSALAEIGLLLLIITLLTNVAARLLVRKVSSTALPVGAGI
jgi:phosphate transport system permease protein